MKLSLNQLFYLIGLQNGKVSFDEKLYRWALRNKLIEKNYKLTEKGLNLIKNDYSISAR